MYRDKQFRVRALDQTLEDLDTVAAVAGDRIRKLFVADGDALVLDRDHWLPILDMATDGFPNLKRISCYATAGNVIDKGLPALEELCAHGLSRLYIGPESGDEKTLKRIAKGATFDDHVVAAQMARAAGMEVSAIFLLGAGGVERTVQHAEASARLATKMDPHFLAALTLTVVPGTPQAKLEAAGRFQLPDKPALLQELRTFVHGAKPTDALFRTNHASNYLPLGGRLPGDGARIVATIDAAMAGQVPLRPEWSRGL
jgi:radical SAM superfamily enzyme YgiQ (UPF0313 family)